MNIFLQCLALRMNICLPCFVLMFLMYFCFRAQVQAETLKYDKETEIVLKDKSRFKISASWAFDDATAKITSPENDMKIYLVQKPFKGDAESLALESWKSVNSGFNLKTLQKVDPPAQEGWEKIHQIVYDVPAKENRSVLSIVRVSAGNAYIMLIDGANAAFDKRGAQFKIIVDTWRPEGLRKEDISQNTAKKFSKEDPAEMDKFIVDSMAKLDVPGAAVAIVQGGKIVYRKGFGTKRLGSADKVTPETMFMIGSTTKPLTTLMLSKLIEQGRMQWKTPIQKILPQFELADKTVSAQVLLKHTACACTGMPRRDMEEVFGSKIKTIDDTLIQLHSMKPTSGFGETFQYSNQLVAVGGLAGANVYNKGIGLFNKYENAMNDLVFEPLKMTSTRVKPREPDMERLASPHARDYDGKMVPIPQKDDDMVYTIAPAGSVWSTVGDLAKYVMMELRNGKDEDGEQLFSEDQIMKRRTPGVKVDDTTHYGLGLFIENDKGVKVIHHAGNTMGFTSHMLFLPKYDIGMVILTNAGGVNGFRNALKQKLLELFLNASPKSAEMVTFAAKNYKDSNKTQQERTSAKPEDMGWIADYVGHYQCKELGPLEIKAGANGHFLLVTPRWTSELGSSKEASGEKLLALTSAPWWSSEIRVQKSPVRKLLLDDAQLSYEFLESAAPSSGHKK